MVSQIELSGPSKCLELYSAHTAEVLRRVNFPFPTNATSSCGLVWTFNYTTTSTLFLIRKHHKRAALKFSISY